MEAWRKKKPLLKAAHYETVLGPMEREVLGNLASVVAEKLIERTQSAPKDPLEELTGMTSGHKEAPTDPGSPGCCPIFSAPRTRSSRAITRSCAACTRRTFAAPNWRTCSL